MARLYKLWDKQEALITPIGEVLTAEEVFARYPYARNPNAKLIICDADITLGRADSLGDLCKYYTAQGMELPDGATPQQKLDAVEAWETRTPDPLDPDAISAEEALYIIINGGAENEND